MYDHQAAMEAFAKLSQEDPVMETPDAPAPEVPEVEQPAQPEPSEPDAPDAEPAPSAEDERFSRLENKLDVVGNYATQQQEWIASQQAAQQQQLYERQMYAEHQRREQAAANPRIVLDSDIQPIAQSVQQMQRMMPTILQTMHVQEQNNVRAAEQALKAKFPDFDEIIPPAERQKAFQAFAQRMDYGQDWGARFEHAYRVFAFEKVKARADELASKREQKRAEEKQAAQKVAPSGAVYQQPVAKLDPSKRGYEDAAAAFKAAMQGL